MSIIVPHQSLRPAALQSRAGGLSLDVVNLFQTVVAGEPRTCGVLCTATSTACAAATPYEVLAPLAHHNPASAAGGKVAVLVGREVQVFQVQRDRPAARAWCGNAVAAAAMSFGRQHINLMVLGPNETMAEVEARVSGAKVRQTWTLPVSEARDLRWRGTRAAVITALNDYAIVLGPIAGAEDAELLRRRMAGDGLTAKLVVVTPGEGATFVEFFNSNGRHGAIPLTGLATLALAERDLPWLREALGAGRVAYRTPGGVRVETLPAIEPVAAGRVRFALPGVEVRTFPLPEMETAA